jgi:hypothetical protein
VVGDDANPGPLDLGVSDTIQDSVDAPSVDGGATNPARLWLSGPENDIHLSDVEPLTPF